MTSATHTAPAGSRPRVRLLAAMLAVVLALLAGLAASAAPHSVSAAPRAIAAAHQPAAPAPEAVSRTMTSHPATKPAAKPAVRTVVLGPGDTLGALAHRYHTTVAALQRANHLGGSTLIYAGHRLTIPTFAAPADRTDSGTGVTPHHSATRTAPAASGASAAVAFARSRLGVPYLWGGAGGGGYDCSGLIQAAWRFAGVTLPRTAAAQAQAGTRIRRGALKPGDLVFTYGYGHVQLYAGGGRVIEAAHPGTRVRYAALPRAATVDAYVRVRGPARTTTTATKTTDASYPHPTATATGSERQITAQTLGSHYQCAAHIIAPESGRSVTATNPSSGPYGLAQALPGSTMARSGTDGRTNPATQLLWMRSSAGARYADACTAWATFWRTHHSN